MPRTLSEQEFNAIKAKVLAGAPPNLDPTNFELWAKNAFPAAIADAENTLEGSATSRFLGGAAANLNPITAVEGLASAVRHPIDTAASIGTAQLTQLKKAIDDFRAGHYSEMVGHTAAGAIPILGPAAAAAGERMATGDIAGGLGEGAGLVTPFVAADAARMGGAAARTAVKGARAIPQGAEALDAVAAMADRAAGKNITDVAAPKVGPNKVRLNNQMADIAPQIARDADLSALSRQGLQAKVAVKLDAATTALDDAADARNAAQAYPTKPILDALQEKRAALTAAPVEGSRMTPNVSNLTSTGQETVKSVKTGVPVGTEVVPGPNSARVAAIDKVIGEVQQLGPVARYESLRRIRQAWDGPAKAKYSPSITQDYLTKAGEASGAADATGVLREHLAGFDPSTAAANADYHLYKTADDVLQATEEIERARPKVGRLALAKAAGYVGGAERGGVAGGVTGVLVASMLERAAELAPTTKILVARQLAKAADLLRAGDAVQAQTVVRQASGVIDRSLKVVKRTAVPGGRISIGGLEAGLPTAADNQPTQPAAIGQR